MILRGAFSILHLVVAAVATVVVISPAYGDDLLDWLHEVTEKKPQAAEVQPQTLIDARLLTLESGESEMYPRISPDGKHLLVVSGKRKHYAITRRLLENGDPLNVVTEDPHAFTSMRWDGSDHTAFLSDRGGDLGLWRVAATGRGAVKRLYRLTGEFVEPVLLKEGGLVAVGLLPTSGSMKPTNHRGVDFSNWKIAGHETRLLHISEKGVQSSLTAGVNPALSPDGKHIVFSMQAGRSWHLFMVDVDGSNLIQLTNARSTDVQPAWSPDGKWVAFTSNRSDADSAKPHKENWDIWMIRRDGRHLTRLTHDAARDGAPAFGANGRVYFHSDRKVNKMVKGEHSISGSVSGFHIWSVPLPAMVK